MHAAGESDYVPQGTPEPESYPSQFDLRNVDGTSYVTPVKNQDPYGSCWAFGAICAAETSILGDPETCGGFTADTLDLSEKHTDWFAYASNPDLFSSQYGEGGHPGDALHLDVGGFSFYATGLFASGAGPVLESENELFEYHGKNKALAYKYTVVDEDGEESTEYVDTPFDAVPENAVSCEPICYSLFDDWSIPEEYWFTQSFALRESYTLASPSNDETGSEDWVRRIDAIPVSIAIYALCFAAECVMMIRYRVNVDISLKLALISRLLYCTGFSGTAFIFFFNDPMKTFDFLLDSADGQNGHCEPAQALQPPPDDSSSQQ